MKYDLSEITEVIRNRRTIYPEQFSERVVQKDMLVNILNNAIWAPTHKRTEPWRFKVYTGEGKAKLAELLINAYQTFTPADKISEAKIDKLSKRLEKTSVVIMMTMKRAVEVNIPEIEEVEAVSCAAQNIMLTATAYGLGSFWSSPKFIYEDGCSEMLGYDKDDQIMGFMYLGYPEVDWPKSHRKPLEYVTEWVDA